MNLKVRKPEEDVNLESLKVVDRVDVGAEGLVEFGGGEGLPLQLLHYVFHLYQRSEIPVS